MIRKDWAAAGRTAAVYSRRRGQSAAGNSRGRAGRSGRRSAFRPGGRSAGVLAVLLCLLLLSGCAAKSSGGTMTEQGMEALESGEYEQALSDFTTALSDGEDEVMAFRGQGIALMGLARYQEAADAFENALSYTDSRMPETTRDIKQYEVAALYREGSYAEVISLAEELYEEEADVENAFYLGAAWLGQGNQDQARSCFDQAVSLSPRDYELYLQIYEIYEENRLSAVGDEYLQTALRIQPDGVEDDYHIGQIYYYLEKYDEARSALSDAVEAGYIPALELMGEVYLAQGDYSHAAASYQSIMAQGTESPEVYNGLALCAIASGDYDGAIDYIEQGLALEEEEGKQQLRFNEIVAYEKKLDYATALVKAESYVSLYPTDEEGQKELTFLNTRGQ